MGLFGALFAGVSGLSSQSNKIGVISNNISNVNTIGFKQGAAAFNTLVVPSGTTSFSPGGVIGQTQQLISQQGLIQATSSATDAAISGGGFFVVNSKSDSSGNVLLTRAGSFTQDSLGNFVNANGYYLQGWVLNADGNPPSNKANPASLTTVHIANNASGAATPTSIITVASNFNATQVPLLGPGQTVKVNGNSVNANNTAAQILVGNDFDSVNTTSHILRGDTFTTSSGTITDTFVYGGFAATRNVLTAAGTASGDGDGAYTLLAAPESATAHFATDGSTSAVKITVANGAKYAIGSSIYISGVTGSIGTIGASDINGQRIITGITGNVVTFTAGAADTTGGSGVTGAGNAGSTALNRTYAFTGNMLDAQSQTDKFLGTSGISNFTNNALSFSITSGGIKSTFQYSTTPTASSGQFSSLSSLVDAINDSTQDLTASLVNGRLYVSPKDATQGMTFTNGDAVGSSSTSKAGIDWIQELDLPKTQIANVNAPATTGALRFNSLTNLAAIAANTSDLSASTITTTGGISFSLHESNSQNTITFTDGQTGRSLLTELLGDSNDVTLSGSPLLSTGLLNSTYDASDPTKNMSSGAITPQFSYPITIFDSLGNSHTLDFNVSRLTSDKWAVEITAVPASDVDTAIYPNGRLKSAIVSFTGTGALANAGGLDTPFSISWNNNNNNGSDPSNITLHIGTPGKTDGLQESSANFNVSQAVQNGSSVGQLTGVSFDVNGFVIASFSNGQTQRIFQLPLGQINNPNGLQGVSGDAYQTTEVSGLLSLQPAGTNGTGTLSTSSLEQSNVDLSTQLTNLIVAQQAYGANSKVLTIADQLLQQLDQIIQ